MKKIDSKKIAMFFIGLVIWFFAVIPFFASLSATRGIILSFSIFMVLSYIYFRIIFKQVGINAKHVMLFVWSYIVVDILQPPKLIGLNTTPLLLSPEQSFSSEVYFYDIFRLVFSHDISYYLTYFGVPILALVILMQYYTGKRLDKIILGSLVK